MRRMRRLPVLAALLVITGCATVPPLPPPTDRQLLTAALNAFMTGAPQATPPTLWLSNEEDSECDRADGTPRTSAGSTPLDLLAFEVFGNQVVASRWASLIEGHRHNYARDLKVETHKAVVVRPDTTTQVEDLCLLDEAKKRNAEKLLVYQVLGSSRGSILVHLRLSSARTGLVEVSRTLLSTAAGVDDRSAR
jgi:hypothetical protein